MYHQKTWHAGASVAVHKSYSPGMGRARLKDEASAASRPAVKRHNDKISKRELTFKLNEYFLPGDGLLTLMYRRIGRADGEGARRDWEKLREEAAAAAKKAGIPFRFVHAIGIGERGAVHHHLVVNREMIGIIVELWTRGPVNKRNLFDKRNYERLAGYFCGQEKGENPDDPKAIHIYGNRYSTSRNLKKVEPRRRAVDANKWAKYPRPLPGMLIDPDSLDVGKNPVNGKPYQFYIMLPEPTPPPGLSLESRTRWVEREQVKNAAEVRWVLDRLYQELAERERQWRTGDFRGGGEVT